MEGKEGAWVPGDDMKRYDIPSSVTIYTFNSSNVLSILILIPYIISFSMPFPPVQREMCISMIVHCLGILLREDTKAGGPCFRTEEDVVTTDHTTDYLRADGCTEGGGSDDKSQGKGRSWKCHRRGGRRVDTGRKW